MGVISDAQREEFDSGNNPITLGSIGYRGNGSLWSSDTSTAFQRITDLPPYGAGDVLMFVLDPPAAASPTLAIRQIIRQFPPFRPVKAP